MSGLTKEAMFNHAAHALRCHWNVLFLDGRNEHGSHVLPMDGTNIPAQYREAVEATLNDQASGAAERILKWSEAMGHEAGHCVVAMWDILDEHGEGAECAVRAIDPVLTAMMCGTQKEQHDNLHAFDPAVSG